MSYVSPSNYGIKETTQLKLITRYVPIKLTKGYLTA